MINNVPRYGRAIREHPDRYPFKIRPARTGGGGERVKIVRDLTVSGSNGSTDWYPPYEDWCNVAGTLIPVSGMPDLRNTPPAFNVIVKSSTASMYDDRYNYLVSVGYIGLIFYSGTNQVLFGSDPNWVDYTPVGFIQHEAAGSGGTPNEAWVENDFESSYCSFIEQQPWETEAGRPLFPTKIGAFLHGLRGSWDITFDLIIKWTIA